MQAIFVMICRLHLRRKISPVSKMFYPFTRMYLKRCKKVHRSHKRPVSTMIWQLLHQSVQLVIHVFLRLLKSVTILLSLPKVYILVSSVATEHLHSTRSKKNVLIPTHAAKLSELSIKLVISKKQFSLVSPF